MIILAFLLIISPLSYENPIENKYEDCIDPNGFVLGPQASWYVKDECALNVCSNGPEGKKEYVERCPEVIPNYDPDFECYVQEKTGGFFPDCCPILVCDYLPHYGQ